MILTGWSLLHVPFHTACPQPYRLMKGLNASKESRENWLIFLLGTYYHNCFTIIVSRFWILSGAGTFCFPPECPVGGYPPTALSSLPHRRHLTPMAFSTSSAVQPHDHFFNPVPVGLCSGPSPKEAERIRVDVECRSP